MKKVTTNPQYNELRILVARVGEARQKLGAALIQGPQQALSDYQTSSEYHNHHHGGTLRCGVSTSTRSNGAMPQRGQRVGADCRACSVGGVSGAKSTALVVVDVLSSVRACSSCFLKGGLQGAVIPYLGTTARQHVLQAAADKLQAGDLHATQLLAAVVAIAKGDQLSTSKLWSLPSFRCRGLFSVPSGL
jgi:hypothetical protein